MSENTIKTKKRGHLTIGYTNVLIKTTCPVCKVTKFTAPFPLAIFRGHSLIPVCAGCTQQWAPELLALLDYFYSEQWQEDQSHHRPMKDGLFEEYNNDTPPIESFEFEEESQGGEFIH